MTWDKLTYEQKKTVTLYAKSEHACYGVACSKCNLSVPRDRNDQCFTCLVIGHTFNDVTEVHQACVELLKEKVAKIIEDEA